MRRRKIVADDHDIDGTPRKERDPRDEKKIASTIMSDDKLTDHFISLVTNEADQRAREREKMRYNYFRIVGAILGITLTAAITLFVYLFPKLIASEVRNEVDRQFQQKEIALVEIENRAKQFVRVAEIISTLEKLSFTIDTATSINPNDRDAIMDMLRESADNAELENNTSFRKSLKTIIDNFALIDYGAGILLIDSIYSDILTDEVGISRSMMHYIWRLLFRDYCIDGELQDTHFERYKRYGSVLYNNRFPEYAIPLEMFLQHLRAGHRRDSTVDRLFSRSIALRPEERWFVALTLIDYSRIGVQDIGGSIEADEIVTTCRSLLTIYESDIDRLICDIEVIRLLMSYADKQIENDPGYYDLIINRVGTAAQRECNAVLEGDLSSGI